MALVDNLISYWPLDEASGNALDAHGSNDLTENGTGGIGTATGILSGARDFEVGDTDYFELADNADLSTGNIDFTMQAWVNLESKPAQDMVIMSKWGSADPREFNLNWSVSDNKFRLIIRTPASSNVIVLASNFGIPPLATWCLLHAWHDSVNNLIGISVNAGTANTTAHSTGITDSTGAFRIGSEVNAGRYWDGLIDEVGFWKRVLTAAERTELYNAGAGRDYAYISGGGAVAPTGIVGGGVGSGAFVIGA